MPLCKDCRGGGAPFGARLCGPCELAELAIAHAAIWRALEAVARTGALDDTMMARAALSRYSRMVSERLRVLDWTGPPTAREVAACAARDLSRNPLDAKTAIHELPAFDLFPRASASRFDALMRKVAR